MKSLNRVLLWDALGFFFTSLINSHCLPFSWSIYIKTDLVLWKKGDTYPNSRSTWWGAGWVVWTWTRNIIQNPGSPEDDRHWHTGLGAAEVHQGDWRAEAHNGKGWGSWVCSSLKSRWLWEDLTAVFSYLMGGWREDTSWRHSSRTTGSGHKLEHGEFQLNIGNIFFTENVVKHWNWWPREVVDLHLWKHSELNQTTATWSRHPCFEEHDGPDGLWKSFPPSIILSFYSLDFSASDSLWAVIYVQRSFVSLSNSP